VQKFIVYLLNKIEAGVWGLAAIAVALAFFLLLSSSTTWYTTAYDRLEDNDAERGAATVSADALGDDNLSQVVYLDQGWDKTDSRWFYNITQGSDLLPYDFFVALEQDNSTTPFRSPENMNRYRYLPQRETKTNPDALPVGMVADTYRGKKYMGFTCAACHTSQVDFKGAGIRIDGGPGAADMDGFMHGLANSLAAARDDAAKRQRFVTAVLSAGNYSDAAKVEEDLKTYAQRIAAYNFFNQSQAKDKQGNLIQVPYGYARLDAFGRIYNRVLEHLLNPEALEVILKTALTPEQAQPLLEKLPPVLTAEDRDVVIDRLISLLPQDQLGQIRDRIFNSPNAPVSYPWLWDIPYHDYVQWNGIGVNAGVGPLGRNTGEVLGVFGTLDWQETKRWMPAPLTGILGIGPTDISFRSSVKGHNLGQIEDRLWKLESPKWEDPALKAILPPIDADRRTRGERLYLAQCFGCHALIQRTDPNRRIVAHMDSVEHVGTDGTMASNSVQYQGFSGILRNQYVKANEVGDVLLGPKAPVAALLTKATENVVATPDPDKWFFTRGADWAVDLIRGFFSNKIKPSVKAGTYTPDTTAAPFDSLMAYKGRPLDGIWATAPYLHNGSVPTLYDLLLPASPLPGDPPKTVYRPKTFLVGSRQLDDKKVGFKSEGYPGFLFDTSLPGNSNAGHEYSTRTLSEEDRWDLVEYLKGL
jgi:mono/diheme cytochrome c family protein